MWREKEESENLKQKTMDEFKRWNDDNLWQKENMQRFERIAKLSDN